MAFEDRPPSLLRSATPIVRADGTPSPEFLRVWNRQRLLNASAETLAVQIDANTAAITALQAIDLIAGTGLAGGGDLSGPDRTFALEDTGVTAGTYGDATNSAQITIDDQGRITSAADVPISGGGGGSQLKAFGNFAGAPANSSGADCEGTFFTPVRDCTIDGLWSYFLPSGTDTDYVFGIASISSGTTIDTVLATATAEATGFGPSNDFSPLYSEPFSSPVSLTAGTTYFIYVYRTSGSGIFGTVCVPATNEGGELGLAGYARGRYTNSGAPAASDVLTAASTSQLQWIAFQLT